MLYAIAIDDDPAALDRLRILCRQTDTVTLSETFTRLADAGDYLDHHPVDLVFLNSHLSTESGIAFWQSIQAYRTGTPTRQGNNAGPMVIFTSASPDCAVASYDLQAIDYLLKPFTTGRFEQAIRKATDYAHWQQLTNSVPPHFLSLRVDAGLVRINVRDILWIEALSNYLKIHLSVQHFLVVRMTMKAILDALPAADFVRVHRSFIVPLHRVQAVHHKRICIGEAQLPLSSYYRDAFYARIESPLVSSPFLAPSSQTPVGLQQRSADARNAL